MTKSGDTSGKSKYSPAELSDLSFERLAQEGMAPTPENYSIWYNYYSGRLPDLNEAIDLIVSLNKKFTRSRCEDLYARFLSFGENAKQIQETGERAEASIGVVLDGLTSAEVENDSIGRSLFSLRDRLEDSVAISTLRAIIGEISSDLKTAADLNRRLHKSFSEAARNFSALREQMHIAGLESRVDTLTGIANRKGFEQALDSEIEQNGNGGEPLSLLMIDLDGFRQFNERHGPLVGDQVLKLLARLIRNSIKGRDFASRYDGDRFAVILPQTKQANALTLAEQIRKAMAGNEISNRTGSERYGRVTVSVGASEYRPGEKPKHFRERAEDALTDGKSRGGNTVCAGAAPKTRESL